MWAHRRSGRAAAGRRAAAQPVGAGRRRARWAGREAAPQGAAAGAGAPGCDRSAREHGGRGLRWTVPRPRRRDGRRPRPHGGAGGADVRCPTTSPAGPEAAAEPDAHHRWWAGAARQAARRGAGSSPRSGWAHHPTWRARAAAVPPAAQPGKEPPGQPRPEPRRGRRPVRPEPRPPARSRGRAPWPWRPPGAGREPPWRRRQWPAPCSWRCLRRRTGRAWRAWAPRAARHAPCRPAPRDGGRGRLAPPRCLRSASSPRYPT